MKKKLIVLIIFTNLISSYSQNSVLNGTWILDKTVYEDGKSLEINHPLYSTYTEYEFLANSIKINEHKFNAKYIQNSIKLDFRELLFSFKNNKLLIQEKGDNKIQIFSKKEDFLEKYPEYKTEIEIRDQDTVYIANNIFRPKFNNELTFDDYLRKNISSYSSACAKNNLFKSKFIVTKEGKIKDIIIINGISKLFDNEFTNALKNSETFFINETGKDFAIEHNFNFIQMFKGLTEQTEKEFYSIQKKAKKYFEKNDFEKAIIEYEKLNDLELNSVKERLGFIYNESFINLGISYLAMNKNEEACKSFLKVGDKKNFNVRNFIFNFCE